MDNYTQLFGLVTDISTIKEEFTMYLLEPTPDNPDLTAMQYWKNVQQLYPQLSQAQVT